MTTLLDLLKALAVRPEPIVEPPAFIAHPAWTEDEGTLRILQGMQANGMDVRVMRDVREPAVPLDEWLAPPGPRCVVCGNQNGLCMGAADGKWRCRNAECT